MNTNRFYNSRCPTTSPNCSWQQFVVSTDDRVAFMQYWLVGASNCPSGWKSDAAGCYANSDTISISSQTYQGLGRIHLQGVSNNGPLRWPGDLVSFIVGSYAYAVAGPSLLGLKGNWTETEFNIFGDGCYGSIDVYHGLLGVKLELIEQTYDLPYNNAAPIPFMGMISGGTAETNTMNVVPGSICAKAGTPGSANPTLTYMQSSFDRYPVPPAPFCLLNDIASLTSD
jgi:hypothetical protein